MAVDAKRDEFHRIISVGVWECGEAEKAEKPVSTLSQA